MSVYDSWMRESLHFLAGGEVEGLFIDPTDTELMDRARGVKSYIPLNETDAVPTDSLDAVRADATAMLDTLVPTSDIEADRLKQWKSQVPHFTPGDAVNFRIYEQGFADPTLGFKPSTVGMSYSELAMAHPGLLEFRFGKDEYQEGYYDNPHVSEIRIAPCPPVEYSKRRTWLLQAMGQTASTFGLRAFAAKEDVSVSAFDGETPLFGDPRTDIQPYQAAVLGMKRRYSADYLAYVRYPNEETFLNVSPWRQSRIRMVPGRFEHRRALFTDNTLNLLLDGMRHGFTEADEEDIASVPVRQVLATTPAEGFERGRDLDLMRAVGRMVLNANNTWVPESGMWSTDFLNTVFAEQDIRDYGSTIVHHMGQNNLFVVKDGHLQMDLNVTPAVEAALPHFALEYYQQRNLDYAAAQERLRRVHVEPVPAVIWRDRSIVVS